jgi:lysophospholipase L1-like esterase
MQLKRTIAQSDVNLITLIVPDKSTVYSDFLIESPFQGWDLDIWQNLDQLSIPSINLKKIFVEQITEVQDLYLPDDTHLGSRGYSLLATEIAKFLKEGVINQR